MINTLHVTWTARELHMNGTKLLIVCGREVSRYDYSLRMQQERQQGMNYDVLRSFICKSHIYSTRNSNAPRKWHSKYGHYRNLIYTLITIRSDL